MAHNTEWPLPPKETLAARALRAASAERRIAELESELDLAHEQLIRRENEMVSLQKSVDLSDSENSRLSSCLEASYAAVDNTKSQLKRMAMALVKAECERDEANKRLQTETSELNNHLEATLARAIAVEKLLSQAHQDLRACNMKNSVMEQEVADAQSALQDKEHQINQLTRSRSTLIDELNRLLKNDKIRNAVLGRAKENQRLLAELFVQLETKMQNPKNDKQIEEINPRRQGEHTRHIGPKSFGPNGRTTGTILKRDLDKDTWLLGPSPAVNAV